MIDFQNPYYLERKHKADELQAQGHPPFGGAFGRTHSLGQVARDFESAGHDPGPETVRVAGRLAAMRVQGKAGFAHLAGPDGRLQV
ncbi:MAG TPA: hypothetical protein VNZ67_15390, partial [bacterium]|nr:hypothetical protein [bacterium]